MSDLDSRTAALIHRSSRLERRVKVLSGLVAVLVVHAVVITARIPAVHGDAVRVPKVIEAQELRIKDDRGRTRISLGWGEEHVGSGSHGGPEDWRNGVRSQLAIHDDDGRERLTLAVGVDGGEVALRAPEGHPVLSLGARPDPSLRLGSRERVTVQIEADAAGKRSSLSVAGPTAGDYASLEAGSDSTISLRFHRDGVARAVLGSIDSTTARRWRVPVRATSSLVLLDARARPVYSAPATSPPLP